MADHIATPDGRIISAAQFVAEALHPSRQGQVTTGVPVASFSLPSQSLHRARRPRNPEGSSPAFGGHRTNDTAPGREPGAA